MVQGIGCCEIACLLSVGKLVLTDVADTMNFIKTPLFTLTNITKPYQAYTYVLIQVTL